MKRTVITLLATAFALTASSQVIWDARILKQTSNAFNSEQYRYASGRLVRDADAILAEPMPSVTDKPATPPSGDKHDYMSLARYWWRNPATPDGLPYIRRDGESNPELKEYDRDRLSSFASGVSKLTLTWRFTNDGKYARRAVEMLRTWFLNPKTRMNPNMKFAQIVRGVDDYGRAEGVLDSYSFIQVLDAVDMLAASGYLPKKELKALQEWFAELVEWMTTDAVALEERAARNNHGTAYDVQLARFAYFAQQWDLARATVNEFAELRLATQIEPDGSQPLELARTTAFGYSTFNLTHFVDMCFIARALNVELYPQADFAIRRALEFIIPYLGHEELFPYQQIQEWDDVEANFSQVLWRAAIFDADNATRYRALYDTFNGNLTKNYLFTLTWNTSKN